MGQGERCRLFPSNQSTAREQNLNRQDRRVKKMSSPDETSRRKLGEIFVAKGIITPLTVERVLERSLQLKRRFGTVLEDLGLINGDELAEALAEQYRCKVVKNLDRLIIDRELLELIPASIALEHLVFPLKRQEGRLAMAMADPTDCVPLKRLVANTKLDITPYIASKRDIHAAICRHYMKKKPSSSKERTVLVIEDDQMLLEMFADILQQGGYRVLKAMNGMEGFKIAITEFPHVVISDLVMPKLDGYAFLTAMRNIPQLNHIPVIMVTGKSRAEEEQKAFEKGFFDLLSKPVAKETLLARIQRAFHFYDYQYRMY